ncbi:Secretory immunoglobulin A-binding protein EsiB [Pandoraea pneumonica]|uniref:Secretory immunoglobulin A-binding protein EsiB n=1 Tax=Pandoraea pneumonica TaxID=2508299 RepID=A0A5E4TUD9_9BURK|nr:caspase family protein [Pandoraea pneumonica]VVD91480.1 Secretory immunoglobulin A-binding protein EsiB [Pandoraea pneumonica]
MTSASLLRCLFALLCAMTVATASSAASPVAPAPARKVALIVGNSGYDGGDRLVSPAGDAKLMGEAFRQLGFETKVAQDLSLEEFNASTDWLAQRARGAQVAVLYYAGHGFESGGDNFLVPVHTGVPVSAMTRKLLLERASRLAAVRMKVMASSPASFIALIDACRVPSRGATGPGLKPEKVGQGELIAFSTADQAAAYDSMRTFGQAIDNSPFAYYLAMNVKAPGATIKHALELTQQQVTEITGGHQRPWIASGLIGDVPLAAQYLVASNPASNPATPHNAPQAGAVRGTSNTNSVGGPSNDGTQAQRANAWDDAEYRITTAAQRADRNDIATLRARKTDPSALTTLGMIFEEGYGVTADRKSAMTFYRRAADMGYPIAQTLLGEAYFEGKAVQRDYAEAEKWFARAASQDYTRARLDLAHVRAIRGQGAGGGMQNWGDAAKIMIDSLNRQQQRMVPPKP